MTRTHMPSAFAVIRTQGSTGPQFQFLTAEETSEQYNEYPVYKIHDADWGHQMEDSNYETLQLRTWDQTVHKFYYEGYPDGLRVWNYWFMPYYFARNGAELPVLEFQYKSWLPRPSFLLPIENHRSMIQDLHRINRERTDQITRMNGGPLSVTPIRPPPLSPSPPTTLRVSNPRRRTSPTVRHLDYRDLAPPSVDIPEMTEDEFMMDDTMPRSLTELIQVESDEETNLPQAFRVHEERMLPQARPLPLPHHVGRLLISSARTSIDACPITAERYSDCSRLSVTSCFHVFHTDSLERWRNDGQNTCPTCRTHIVNVIAE